MYKGNHDFFTHSKYLNKGDIQLQGVFFLLPYIKQLAVVMYVVASISHIQWGFWFWPPLQIIFNGGFGFGCLHISYSMVVLVQVTSIESFNGGFSSGYLHRSYLMVVLVLAASIKGLLWWSWFQRPPQAFHLYIYTFNDGFYFGCLHRKLF